MHQHVPILTHYTGSKDGGYFEIGCTCRPWYGSDHKSAEPAMREWEVHAGERQPRPSGNKILGNRSG